MITGTRYTPTEALYNIVSAQVTAHLYYLLVLTVYTLLTPLFLKCAQSRIKSIIVIAIGLLALILGYIFDYFDLETANLWNLRVAWLPFYYAGLLCRIHKPQIASSTRKKMPILLASTFISQIVEMYLMPWRDNLVTTLRISSFAYSTCLIALVYSLDARYECKGQAQKALKKIGDDSYAIYLIHMAFLMIVSKLFDIVGFSLAYPIQNSIEVLITIAVSMIAIAVMKRILPRKFSHLVLGI